MWPLHVQRWPYTVFCLLKMKGKVVVWWSRKRIHETACAVEESVPARFHIFRTHVSCIVNHTSSAVTTDMLFMCSADRRSVTWTACIELKLIMKTADM